MGLTLAGLGRHRECVAVFERGLASDPEDSALHFHKAWTHLLLGEFREGWRDYEWRWEFTETARPVFRQPLWTGESLAGKTILVYSEQGFGDSLQLLALCALAGKKGREDFAERSGRCGVLMW